MFQGMGPPTLLDHNGQPFSMNGRMPQGGMSGQGYGDWPLPHVLTFNAVYSSGDKTYWHGRWDEALRFAREAALVMKRDAFLMSLMQERRLAVSSIPWELEIPDEKDPIQRITRDAIKRSVENIYDFRKLISSLLEAVWYGRYGVQLEWDWMEIQGKRVMTVADWFPINGDKIGYEFRGVPYILVNSGLVSPRPDIRLVTTTAGGMGLALDGTWRDRFIIHRHEIDDADYYEGEMAGGIWGVGVRTRIFWMDWIRREYMEWITAFLERVGLGVTLWYYDGGNPQALAAVANAAKNQSRRANLFVPIFSDGKGSPKGLVERIETPVNGVDALRMLKEDIEQKIERFVVGQEASAHNSGSKGLGNQAGAEFQMDTKEKITNFDAMNLAETLTGNQRNPGLIYLIQRWSFPETMPDRPGGFRVKFKFGVEKQDSDKKLNAIGKVIEWGIPVKEEEVRAAAGLSKPDIGDAVIQLMQPQGGEQPGGAPGGPDGSANPPGSADPGAAGDEAPFEPPFPDEPAEFAKDLAEQQEGIKRDMLARKSNTTQQPPKVSAPPGWNVYHGARGGIGWKNAATGQVIYATSGRTPFGKQAGGGKGGGGGVQAGRAGIGQIAVKKAANGMALAKWYAEQWNFLAQLGMMPTDAEKREVSMELHGSGASVWFDTEGDKQWHAIETPVDEEEEAMGQPDLPATNQQQQPQQERQIIRRKMTHGDPAQYAAEHAPEGGINIGGKQFKGGEWIPKEVMEEATPAQKAAIEKGRTDSAHTRLYRGPLQEENIQQNLSPHGHHQLSGGELRDTKATYKALMSSHEELMMHRIEELVTDAKKVMDSIPDDAEGGEKLREQFGKRMKAYSHMLEWAREHGMTPEAEAEETPPSPKKSKQKKQSPAADEPKITRDYLMKNAIATSPDADPMKLMDRPATGLEDKVHQVAKQIKESKGPFQSPTVGEVAREMMKSGAKPSDIKAALVNLMKSGRAELGAYTQAINTIPEEDLEHTFPLAREPKYYVRPS